MSVQYGWEPCIVWGGRARARHDGFVNDYVSANPVRWQDEDQGVIGMKPDAFCFWLFDVLGATRGDELHDLYRGSGAVGRAWDAWLAQPRLSYRLRRGATDDQMTLA